MTINAAAGNSWPPLEPGEILLTDEDELVWRQVNPKFFDRGQVTEQAFQPTSDDPRRLSCSRESLQSAEGAFKHFTNDGYLSVGTFAVTVGEVTSAGSRAVDDSEVQTQSPPTPGHTFLDYRALDRNERRDLRDDLAFYATSRGLIHP